MRALINASKLLEIGIDKMTILKTVIVKNMQRDDINTIIKKLDFSNQWARTMKELSDI
jgi:ribosomal protein L25 (general stress protein Ctc)